MKRHKKSRLDWQELRRRQGIQLLRKGWTQVEVADALGVTQGAVSQWAQVVKSQGLRGLRSIERPGAPRKLERDHLNQIPELLWHGAESYGFRGNLWTNHRIAIVLQREFGVCYHPHHVARIMRELKWTPHLPITRATQRDEIKIKNWRRDRWPELKKSSKREKKPISAG